MTLRAPSETTAEGSYFASLYNNTVTDRHRERRGLETVVEREFRRSLDRERHRQTRTTLTDRERSPANI